jgi:8-oxo-dGTP pyrophosphatase MutT (NUDIX family)
VYVFRDAGEVLLLRRTEQWGGFWQGVSGAPEWGETDDEGAVREVREETGFDVADSLQPIGFRYELRRDDDPDSHRWEQLYGPEVRTIPEEVYVARVPDGVEPVLSPYEHDAFRWCSVDEALELLAWENNRRALVAAAAFLEANAT